MAKAPLIGIPCYQDILPPEQRPRFWMFQTYVKALDAAGAIPVLVPLLDKATSPALLDRLDGVLLAGGDDVNPVCYQQDPHPKTETPDDLRDRIEIEMAVQAVNTRKPLLAICRGMQVLNVAFGGTLLQHVPDLVPQALKHEFNYNDYHLRANITHQVQIAPESRLASILGTTTTVGVNSFHHQAVDRIADGFHAVASSPDGVVEALEGNADQFMLAVQWHPEDMYHENDQMRALFEAFIRYIRENG